MRCSCPPMQEQKQCTAGGRTHEGRGCCTYRALKGAVEGIHSGAQLLRHHLTA